MNKQRNMLAFNKAFEIIIGIEQGYVNDPNDLGGETKYGISKKYHPDINIKNLTIESAKSIYYHEYWNTKYLNLNMIAEYDESIAIELFDIAVNQSVRAAAKNFQETLNLMNRAESLYDDIKVDGWVGSKSLAPLNKLQSTLNKKAMIKIINGLQFMRYYDIIQTNHMQEKNFVGWMKRV